jgi:hypothetical protein
VGGKETEDHHSGHRAVAAVINIHPCSKNSSLDAVSILKDQHEANFIKI